MTVVRRERSACLGSSVTVAVESVAVQQLWLLIARSRVTPRVACQPGRSSRRRSVRRGAATPACSWRCCLFPVHDGQGPTPAGQLAGHPDRGDGGALLAGVERAPTLVQPAVGLIGPGPHHKTTRATPRLSNSHHLGQQLCDRVERVAGANDRHTNHQTAPLIAINDSPTAGRPSDSR
jgi:hypothetical protein